MVKIIDTIKQWFNIGVSNIQVQYCSNCDTLDGILGVFNETKERLARFVNDKKEENSKLEFQKDEIQVTINNNTAEVLKATQAIDGLSKIVP